MTDLTRGEPVERMHVQIAELPRVYTTLLSILPQLGLNETQARAICEQSVEAECEFCGTKISGSDLARITSSSVIDETIADPKLERVRKKYCARMGCDSLYYRVKLFQSPDVDWKILKDRILQTVPSSPAESSPAKKTISWRPTRQTLRLVVLAAGAAILLFFVHHWYYGQRIPIIQKKHDYRVAPMPQ